MNPANSSFKYAIGLVIYKSPQNLRKRVDLIIKLEIPLYIFDNSPEEDFLTNEVKMNSSVFYFTAGKNLGIGYALKAICATAYAHGNQHLIYFDQDTSYTPQTLNFINDHVNFLPSSSLEYYAALVFSRKSVCSSQLLESSLAISSGSLFNLGVLKKIGWHNHKYFVDCVDYEFCIRARRLGYKIGVISNTPDFDHVSEQPDRPIVFCGKQMLVRRYSLVRNVDALSAYAKLIIREAIKGNIQGAVILLRSMMIYTLGQLIARLVTKKA